MSDAAILFLLLAGAAPAAGSPAPDTIPAVVANANRTAAGRLSAGTLAVELVARPGRWFPEARPGPSVVVYAFAEGSRAPMIPGPLIRVREGTRIRAIVHNLIPGAALVVHGLCGRPCAPADTVHVAAGRAREVRFTAGAPGTYYYWATTTGAALVGAGEGTDSQLHGAFIVDGRNERPRRGERTFVMGAWSQAPDTTGPPPHVWREALVINGKSWPHTERMTFTVGDSVFWRWINANDRAHPMHLHGFYYRVLSRGDIARDTVYPAEAARLAVTERMTPGSTMAMAFSPHEPGNWIFHCHVLYHISVEATLEPRTESATPHAGGHTLDDMAGLVLGIHARRGSSWAPPAAPASEPLHLRVFVQRRDHVFGDEPGFGFVLQRDAREPAPDSIEIPGSPLVVTRGEAVRITVANRAREPTSVHWHGLELPSYFDGVAGISGGLGRLAPAIAPGDSFTVEFTPVRAGTFIYHTHLDDVRQMSLGLYGPLIVREPGRPLDTTRDHTIVLSWAGQADPPVWLVNGGRAPRRTARICRPAKRRAGPPANASRWARRTTSR